MSQLSSSLCQSIGHINTISTLHWLASNHLSQRCPKLKPKTILGSSGVIVFSPRTSHPRNQRNKLFLLLTFLEQSSPIPLITESLVLYLPSKTLNTMKYTQTIYTQYCIIYSILSSMQSSWVEKQKIIKEISTFLR